MQLSRGLRVLVVQHQPEFAADLAHTLGAAGHDVEIAEDGPPAVQAVRTAQPAVVFLDLVPNGTDGLTVVRAVRDLAAWRRPLFVSFSDDANGPASAAAQTAGVDLQLGKPVPVNALLDFLRRFQAIVNDMDSFDPMI